MKKSSLGLIVLILSFLGFSKSFADPFNGFYVGALGGGSFFMGTEHPFFARTTIPEGAGIGSFSVPGRHAVKSNSLIGMLTLGYGETFSNNGYLGGELFVDWTNHRDTTHIAARVNVLNLSVFNHVAELKVDPVSFGVDLRPGYQICDPCFPSLLYVRVGVGVKRIKQLVSIRGAAIAGGDPVEISNSVSRSVTRAVLRLGLGFEYFLMDNVNIRADYIFTYLGNYSTGASVSRTAGGVFEGLRVNNQLHLVNNAFLLGLAWHW